MAETERCEPRLQVVRPWTEILSGWQARRGVATPPPRLPPPYPASAPWRIIATVGMAAAFLALAGIAAVTEPTASRAPVSVPRTPHHAPASAAPPRVEAPAPSVQEPQPAPMPTSWG